MLKYYIFKRFSTIAKPSFSFKNKLNLLFKHIHPDVLGSTCPNEYRTVNEKSMQDFNSYIECLEKSNTKFDNKAIDFYVKIEEKSKEEQLNISFSKVSINLDPIDTNISETNKISMQIK
jgi:hypothetical protein